MIRTEYVTLDIKRTEIEPQNKLFFRQFDKGASIVISLESQGSPLDSQGLKAFLRCETNGGIVSEEISLAGSTATYVLATNLTSCVGIVRPYVELRLGDNVIATTGSFVIQIDRAVDLRGAEATHAESFMDKCERALSKVEQTAHSLEKAAAEGRFNGAKGDQGIPGKDGAPGKPGKDGAPGKDGKDGICRAALEFDSLAGEYSPESIARFLASRKDGLAYGVALPNGMTTKCRKIAANAAIDNPIPGVIGTPAQDPYIDISPFLHLEVNAKVDVDGTAHVTAVAGDGNFSRTGENGNVWILTPTLYWKFQQNDYNETEILVSDSALPGYELQPHAILPNGEIRPFMLYAKYGLSVVNGEAKSISGQKLLACSHNSLIDVCKNKTTGYSGKTVADDWYLKVMFLLKYATKNSQSVFNQCSAYWEEFSPAIAESSVKRIVLKSSEADKLLVGSSIYIGSNTSGSATRWSNDGNDISDGARILSKEVLPDGNVALNLNLPVPINVETTYRIFSVWWETGSCDLLEGDGSVYSNSSGKEPFVCQGIEIGYGRYEVLGDTICSCDGQSNWKMFVNPSSEKEAMEVTSDYIFAGEVATPASNSWVYPQTVQSRAGFLFGSGEGASTTTGICDGQYTTVKDKAQREVATLGYLNCWGHAGLFCVDLSGWLGHVNGLFGSRLSAVGRAGVN